jgi:hypothetical protein
MLRPTPIVPRRLLPGIALLALWFTQPARALVLDEENRIVIVLAGGTSVSLIGEATDTPGTKSKRYHYLPTNLRLSQRPDATPEFLFMKFTTDRRADQGGVSGAIMHFLMEWGLTASQEADLEAKLNERISGAQVMGAVQLETQADAGSFQIVSATLADSGLTKSIVTSGKAPLVQGGKAAVGTRLSPEGAALLAASFEKTRSIADLSIALNYSYVTLAPAAHGRIDIDWSKLEREGETLRAEYAKTQTGTSESSSCFLFICVGSSSPEYAYSYEEVANQYKFLEKKNIITLHWDEIISDERVTKIREAFFQSFLNLMAKPANAEGPPPAPSDKEKAKSPDIQYGTSYKFLKSAFKEKFERGHETIDLNYRASARWPFQLVGNLASWYDAVRDNPKCVGSQNLDDPFFDHRDISFILDLDAKEIFDEAINFVSVNVRKARSAGPPFESRLTMDAQYVQKKGLNATVTYARGEDENPDVYEYQARWALRGGQVWPANPPWQKGTWEGVSLSPPIVPRNIDVEADLQSMKASGITRATVQIRYPKFGREAEENVQLSAAKNEAVVSKRLFVDRGSTGYVYRVILNHKTEGKLVLPWSSRVGDNYVFVAVPPDLLADGPLKTEAKEAAKALESGAIEKVLDRLNGLVGAQP